MRRRRGEHDPRRPAREIRHERAAIRARREMMRFVDDEDVEGYRFERSTDLRALHQVDGRDDERRRAPWIDPRRQRRRRDCER